MSDTKTNQATQTETQALWNERVESAARAWTLSGECELMDTYLAHEESFQAGAQFVKAQMEADKMADLIGQEHRLGTQIDLLALERDVLLEEVDRLKRIIAKELTENDDLGSEFTYVMALKEENARLREALEVLVQAKDVKEWNGNTDYYRKLKDKGWTLARAALMPKSP